MPRWIDYYAERVLFTFLIFTAVVALLSFIFIRFFPANTYSKQYKNFLLRLHTEGKEAYNDALKDEIDRDKFN